jgi:hypothetical protein
VTCFFGDRNARLKDAYGPIVEHDHQATAKTRLFCLLLARSRGREHQPTFATSSTAFEA